MASLPFLVALVAASGAFAATPSAPSSGCSIAKDLAGIFRPEMPAASFAVGAMAIADAQKAQRCAGAALELSALYALSRAQTMRSDDGRSMQERARQLAEEGWVRQPGPNEAFVRAIVFEVTLPETRTSAAVEDASRRWVDALAAAGRADGWQNQPSDLRRVAAQRARSFALRELARGPRLTRSAWVSLVVLTQLSLVVDRPTDRERWMSTFPDGMTPNRSDELDLRERLDQVTWSRAIPVEPGAEGSQLAAGLYWRMRLYGMDSSGISAVEFLDSSYIDTQAPILLLDQVLAGDLDALADIPTPRSLVMTPTGSLWTRERQGAMSLLLAHDLVRRAQEPKEAEDWQKLTEALDLLAFAVEVEASAGPGALGPVDVDRVGKELLIRFPLGLEGGRGDEIADRLVRLAGRLPLASRLLVLIALPESSGLEGLRRSTLARRANEVAWAQMASAPTSIESWLLALDTYLYSTTILDALATADGRLTGSFQPDPTAFSRRFVEPLVDPSLEEGPLGGREVLLGSAGCTYLAELARSGVIGRVSWRGLGPLTTLPGADGPAVTTWIMGADGGGGTRCRDVEEPLVTDPRDSSPPAGVPRAETYALLTRWFTVVRGMVEATSPTDPVRLGARYPVRVLSDAISGEEAPEGRDFHDMLCSAAEAEGVVEGSEARHRLDALAEAHPLGPCSKSTVPLGAFRPLSVSVQMSTRPRINVYAVSVSDTPYADQLSEWLTADLRDRVPREAQPGGDPFAPSPEADPRPSWRGPLIPEGVHTTLVIGAWSCDVTPTMLASGATVYAHRMPCVPGLPSSSSGTSP